jgi:hypothetical protein
MQPCRVPREKQKVLSRRFTIKPECRCLRSPNVWVLWSILRSALSLILSVGGAVFAPKLCNRQVAQVPGSELIH